MTKSKQKILKAASLLFSEFGFEGVSMRDIAKNLGISKAALYFHFKSKKELYLKTLKKTFEELTETINKELSKAKSRRDYLFYSIYGYLNFGLKNKNLIKISNSKISKKDSEIKEFVAKLRKNIERKFQDILQKKKKTKKIESKFLVTSLLGVMDKLILEAALFNKRLNIKKSTFNILKILKI